VPASAGTRLRVIRPLGTSQSARVDFIGGSVTAAWCSDDD
jgi:hypothetical protein